MNEIQDFRYFLDNYIYEANVVANNAIHHNKNISQELIDYTKNFIQYAETKGVSVGIVIIYSDNMVHIVNYLNDPIHISTIGTLYPENEAVMDFTEIVMIDYKNETYSFSLSGSKEIKALFVKDE